MFIPSEVPAPVLIRWYRWGIQGLVSTYSNRNWVGGGGLPSQNSKCQDLPKIQLGGGMFYQVKTQRRSA